MQGCPVAEHLNRDVYAPWVDAFSAGRELGDLSRAGLYQRVIMLLALDVSLRDAA